MATSPHFSDKELRCKHCGDNRMEPEFLKKLERIRLEVGPMRLSSAYRCPEHNSNVSSTGATGPHTTGRAVDVLCSGAQAFLVMEVAFKHGMTGIGVKQKGPHGGRFIHLDDLDTAQRPWVWGY